MNCYIVTNLLNCQSTKHYQFRFLYFSAQYRIERQYVTNVRLNRMNERSTFDSPKDLEILTFFLYVLSTDVLSSGYVCMDWPLLKLIGNQNQNVRTKLYNARGMDCNWHSISTVYNYYVYLFYHSLFSLSSLPLFQLSSVRFDNSSAFFVVVSLFVSPFFFFSVSFSKLFHSSKRFIYWAEFIHRHTFSCIYEFLVALKFIFYCSWSYSYVDAHRMCGTNYQ